MKKILLGLFSFVFYGGIAYSSDDLPDVFVPEGETFEFIADNTDADRVEFDTVVIEKDATLKIPFFKSIYIQHLITVEGSRIKIAHQGSGGDGSGSESGDDGAKVRIFVERIDAHIVIEARGGDGGKGKDGRNGQQGQAGADGRRGRTFFFGLFYIGNGDDGEDGYPGEDGEDGEDGGNGGNGGIVSLYFNDKSDESKILIDVEGGKAGKGGKAGLGGLGGPGGRGGKGLKRGKPGRMGRNGLAGIPGKPGTPGSPGEASVYQVGEELYSCLAKLDVLDALGDLEQEDIELCREDLKDKDDFVFSDVSLSHLSPTMMATELPDGTIYINADGRNGELAPDALQPGSPPASAGTNGSDGGKITLFVHKLPKTVVISAIGGNGGHGGRGGNGQRGADGANGKNAHLFRKATAGRAGHNGGNGGNGSNGGNGGNGGHIRVIFLKDEVGDGNAHWEENFKFELSGGEEGIGGHGGKGGRGGAGGRGGRIFLSSDRMPAGPYGQNGLDGLAGLAGQKGHDGIVEPIEVESVNDWILDEFAERALGVPLN